MKEIVATYGQTIYDIAILEYGCYEGIFILMEDNQLDLTSILTPGHKLKIRTEIPRLNETNLSVKYSFQTSGIRPNAGYLVAIGDYEALDFENIDFNAL
jgi:hypothetical protein